MLKLKLHKLLGKDPDAGKDWRQEEKGTTDDEMVGWHHQLNGHEFEQASGVADGQGSLACCSPWGCKESDTTERLNWTYWRQSSKTTILHHPQLSKHISTSLRNSELWCWRRLLRVPWTGRRLNQSILKEINCEYSLEGLMLKLQYLVT